MNKRGDIASIFILIGFMIGVVIMVYVAGLLFFELIPQLQANEEIASNPDSIEAVNTIYGLSSMFDWALLFIFIGSLLGLMISAYFIDSFPGMTFIFLILLFIAVMVSMQLANVFYEVRISEGFETISANMPISNFIFGPAFPLIILVFGVITAMILYGKGRSGGTQDLGI